MAMDCDYIIISIIIRLIIIMLIIIGGSMAIGIAVHSFDSSA